MKAEHALTLLLRLAGTVLLVAVVPAAMPFAWMDAIHRQLGMGQLPDAPIVHYLTRSASLLYAYHGALILFVSLDLRRYLPVVKCLAWLGVTFGAAMLAIDLVSGMPAFWTLGEGMFIVALCGAILALAARVKTEA